MPTRDKGKRGSRRRSFSRMLVESENSSCDKTHHLVTGFEHAFTQMDALLDSPPTQIPPADLTPSPNSSPHTIRSSPNSISPTPPPNSVSPKLQHFSASSASREHHDSLEGSELLKLITGTPTSNDAQRRSTFDTRGSVPKNSYERKLSNLINSTLDETIIAKHSNNFFDEKGNQRVSPTLPPNRVNSRRPSFSTQQRNTRVMRNSFAGEGVSISSNIDETTEKPKSRVRKSFKKASASIIIDSNENVVDSNDDNDVHHNINDNDINNDINNNDNDYDTNTNMNTNFTGPVSAVSLLRAKQRSVEERRSKLLRQKTDKMNTKRIKDHLMITRKVREEIDRKKHNEKMTEIREKLDGPVKHIAALLLIGAAARGLIKNGGEKILEGRRNRAAGVIQNAWKVRGAGFRRWEFFIRVVSKYKNNLLRPIILKRKNKAVDVFASFLGTIHRAKMIRSITAKINDKASLISKTIRTFRACTEARERALGMLWDLKVSTMSDVYRRKAGLPNFIRKKEAAVKSWVVDRRFDYIEEMNRGFEEEKIRSDSARLGLKMLSLGDCRSFLLGENTDVVVVEAEAEIEKKKFNRMRRWDGGWLIFSKAVCVVEGEGREDEFGNFVDFWALIVEAYK